jgi:hypothetical protein
LAKQIGFTILMLTVVFACDKQPTPSLQPPVDIQIDPSGSRTTDQSDQLIIDEISELAFEIKCSLNERKLTFEERLVLTEKIKSAGSAEDLVELLGKFSRHPNDIYLKVHRIRK